MELTIALNRYDRHVPIFDGSVKPPAGVTIRPLEVGESHDPGGAGVQEIGGIHGAAQPTTEQDGQDSSITLSVRVWRSVAASAPTPRSL